MANIAKKYKKSKIAKKVYTLSEIKNYGSNPYRNLIQTILIKHEDVGELHIAGEVNRVRVDKEIYYEDTRYGIKLYPTARKFFKGLHDHPFEILYYLCTKMLDNLNIAKINNEADMIKYCGIDKDAEESIHNEIAKGKEIIDIELEKKIRIERYVKRAINTLITRDAIQKTNLTNYYWVNPKITIRGNLALVPLEHNDFNNKVWIVQHKNKHYSYRGYHIEKVGKDYLVHDDTGSLFGTREECKEYINTLIK